MLFEWHNEQIELFLNQKSRRKKIEVLHAIKKLKVQPDDPSKLSPLGLEVVSVNEALSVQSAMRGFLQKVMPISSLHFAWLLTTTDFELPRPDKIKSSTCFPPLQFWFWTPYRLLHFVLTSEPCTNILQRLALRRPFKFTPHLYFTIAYGSCRIYSLGLTNVCTWEGPITVKSTFSVIAPILASSPTFPWEPNFPSFTLLACDELSLLYKRGSLPYMEESECAALTS